MPKFIHVSDLHLGFHQYGLRERFRDYATTFQSIVDDAFQHDADFLLIAGDLFHFRNIDPETYIQSLKILQKAKDRGLSVFAIEGNHDIALHRDRVSWLRILEEQGCLKLLKIKKRDGQMVLGDHVDIGDTRVFGVRYIGYSTKKEIIAIKEEIDRVNQELGKKDFTILMMHFGMEGMLHKKISGEVSLSALQPLREVVDYLALGHYHMRYEFEDWIYNGGSPDMVSMEEFGQDKGYYLYDGGAKFVDTWPRIRPVRRIYVDVTDCTSEMEVRTKVQQKIIDSKESYSQPPLIDLIVKGRVNLPRDVFDIKWMEQQVREKLKNTDGKPPLNVNVKLRIEGETVDVIERDVEGHTRRAIEEMVVRKLILADERFKSAAELLVPGIMDIKETILALDKPEQEALEVDGRLREIYKDVQGYERAEEKEEDYDTDEEAIGTPPSSSSGEEEQIIPPEGTEGLPDNGSQQEPSEGDSEEPAGEEQAESEPSTSPEPEPSNKEKPDDGRWF